MKRMIYRVAVGGVACLLALSMLGGCRKKPTDEPNPTPTTSASTSASTTQPTEAPTAPPINMENYNRLTGLYDNAAGGNSRAVGVMIGNNAKSRPQIGLSAADLFVETETEGGITRIMAVFSDASRVPAQLCPIRSCRSPFVLMAQSLDAVYVHAGGSVAGLKTLANSGIDSINALGNNGNTFWRDEGMKSSRGMEYSLSTSGGKLSPLVSSRGIRATSDRAPFTFGESVSGDPCEQLQVTFSGAQTNSYVYDPARGVYKKYVGKLGSASAHVTTDNAAIEVANVVVMYDTKYAENETTINFNLSSGNGLLCNGGKSRPIQWTRTASGLTFTENGQTATFLPGKTYICLVNKANAGSTITK